MNPGTFSQVVTSPTRCEENTEAFEPVTFIFETNGPLGTYCDVAKSFADCRRMNGDGGRRATAEELAAMEAE